MESSFTIRNGRQIILQEKNTLRKSYLILLLQDPQNSAVKQDIYYMNWKPQNRELVLNLSFSKHSSEFIWAKPQFIQNTLKTI